ncbi:aluminum-activated malate transporter 14-like [Gastrolobium bilobum]|uniref:aluminum-activated malate transporter 14-like n=1 Tax=Gastrolobium bilobum TaxID=150636 RepID=UPI002AB159E9|nr:aluminum-activated malate transporter 14-like [Gastrolobium bilobum]
MESIEIVSITNEEENIAHTMDKKKLLSPIAIDSYLWKNKFHCSLFSIASNFWDKHMNGNFRNIIHSIKVGIALVLVSLLFILKPLYDRVGDNAMWAIITVVVVFEFYAGASLGKGFNRGMATLLGGGLGFLTAILALRIGGVADLIMLGASVFISGSVATYLRTVPSIKKRYDYGFMIFIMTFNLVVMYGISDGSKDSVWKAARERLSTILMGLLVCICVSLFVFPMWASDELHHSTVSRFRGLANTIQDIIEECTKLAGEKENQPRANNNICKSLLNSKSKDELMANFAKWEPWHGKFGFSYPWEKYLNIGEALRELAAFIVAVELCLRGSEQSMASLRQSKSVHLEPCEAIGSWIVWTLRELGDSMKQMRKCETEGSMLAKLKAAKAELNLVISTSKVATPENGEVLTIANFGSLLMEMVEKVETSVKEVEELGDLAGFSTHGQS